MSTSGPPEDWEVAEEALHHLEINEAEVSDAKSIDVNGDSAPSTSVEEGPVPSPAQDGDDGLERLVDHALRDALCRPKHRNSVLRLEAEVQAFVADPSQSQYLFAGDMSSYERLLTHRTAQHWGLDTTTINQGPDHGRILASRTAKSAPPAVKLADLPVAMEEPASGNGNGAAANGNGAAAPRLLVRKRNDRGGSHRHADHPGMYGGGQGMLPGFPRPAPMEDRELHYERTRARIFGDTPGGYPTTPQHQQQQQQQQQGHQGQQGPGGAMSGQRSPYANGAMGPVPLGGAYPAPPRPGAMMPGGYMHQGGVYGPAGGSNGGGGGGRGNKAQLRNRQEDLSDPDFRRGRHGPRFDPGFGEEAAMQGGMYVRPTYGSEFPELPPNSGQPGPHGVVSPAAAAMQGYPGAYPPSMMPPHMSGGGYAYAAHPGMLPPGMMHAHMPGAPSNMQMYPGAPVQYGGGAYAGTYMQMTPYGYVAVRPGQDGMVSTMVPMAMYPGSYPPGAYPGGPVPGGGMGPGSPGMLQQQMQQQQQQQQQMLARQRPNGARTNGRQGGSRGGSGSTANTPRAAPATPTAQQQSTSNQSLEMPPPPPPQQQQQDGSTDPGASSSISTTESGEQQGEAPPREAPPQQVEQVQSSQA